MITITKDGPVRATITQIEVGELWRPKNPLRSDEIAEVIGFYEDDGGNIIVRSWVSDRDATWPQFRTGDNFVRNNEPLMEP